MPDRRRLEARVLGIVERVTAGGRAEDDLVECKANWPDPVKAARRLAGQANAARGEPILWIVGLDEDAHQLRALGDDDADSWWARVRARFADEVTPEPDFLHVPVGSQSVMAIEFTTDRSPYVVTTDGQGGVQREVPWRSGTGVRSAHRHELLRILVATVAVPRVELFEASMTATELAAGGDRYGNDDGSARVNLVAGGYLFIEAMEPVMLPGHRWKGLLKFQRHGLGPVALDLSLTHPGPSSRSTPQPRGVDITASGLYVNGPGTVQVHGIGNVPVDQAFRVRDAAYVSLELELPVSGADRPIVAEAILEWRSGEKPAPEYDSRAKRILGAWTQRN